MCVFYVVPVPVPVDGKCEIRQVEAVVLLNAVVPEGGLLHGDASVTLLIQQRMVHTQVFRNQIILNEDPDLAN